MSTAAPSPGPVPPGHPQMWAALAACRDTPVPLFFSEDPADVAAALELCAGCPVRRPCLEWAMAEREHHGVWGGTTEQQRRRIFRARSRRNAA